MAFPLSRRRIYEIIEAADEGDKLSNLYDIFMIVVIGSSIFGIAIIALSSGIITAGFLSELNAIEKSDSHSDEK